jgi:two-component system CheB/CheR fusion protein
MQNTPLTSAFFTPVVCIGASAGGLEPLSELIEALKPDLGFAYLVVSHMEARQESHLAEILSKRTLMAVEVAASQEIASNTVYVIPPDTVMTIEANHLMLRARRDTPAKNLPIDALLTSLADQRPGRGIAVILSGTGSDGAEGVKAVKEAGGVVFAQTPDSAKFDGMPKSAIGTGCVDLALRPNNIAKEICKIALHPYFNSPAELSGESTSTAVMGQIFDLIAKVYHADFTQYKSNTIQRRLQRRMALINEVDLRSYLNILHDNPVELAALYDDLLIRVTCFFREEAIYTALMQSVFPRLFEKRDHSEPLRIWIPACASGEEVYSFAICLLEYLGENSQHVTIQIFGTDLNEAAIEQARNGLYPDSIAERVSAERLQRYFVREQQRYRISKQVRELCVFARQNVVLDPPFSRMDVISCCNLLIYLDAGLQRRALRHFHYALKTDGFLILGPAETADDDSHSFKRAEGNQRMLYQRASPARGALDMVLSRAPVAKQASTIVDSQPSQFLDATQVQRKADGILLSRFSPASILIDDRFNIVQFRGQTSPYLEHSSGTASLNLHRVAQPGILMQLMPLLKEVHDTGNTVFRDDLRIESIAGQRKGSVEIIPLREPATKTGFCLILFDANVRPSKPEGRPEIPESQKDARIRQLEGELDSLRDYLQATNEAYEAALEESRSAQEELQSANEEFLSGNEELVISREELQATNEELTTSNEELLSRSRELHIVNAELTRSRKEATFNATYAESVIDTVAHPLLVLDQALLVHRANHAFYDMFLTNPGATLNRRIFNLGDGQWNIPELRTVLDQVVSLNTPVTAYRVKHDFPASVSEPCWSTAARCPHWMIDPRGSCWHLKMLRQATSG